MAKVAGYEIKLPKPLKQGDLEAYDVAAEVYTAAAREAVEARLPKALRSLIPQAVESAVAVQRGVIVQAAAALGWIDGLTPAEVSELKPGVIVALSEAIYPALLEARRIPKG